MNDLLKKTEYFARRRLFQLTQEEVDEYKILNKKFDIESIFKLMIWECIRVGKVIKIDEKSIKIKWPLENKTSRIPKKKCSSRFNLQPGDWFECYTFHNRLHDRILWIDGFKKIDPINPMSKEELDEFWNSVPVANLPTGKWCFPTKKE